MTRIVEIGKALQSRIKVFFDRPLDASASPLEVMQAVLDTLEARVQPTGRGHRVFPYTHVVVKLAPLAAERTAVQAVFDGLGDRLRDRLVEVGCPVPASLDVRIAPLKRAPEDWPAGQLFAVECRQELAPAPAAAEVPRQRQVQVTVVKGAATRDAYLFTQSVISIGRTAEPTDAQGRVRRNDVVFEDVSDGVTETVGRAHARLQLDARSGEYRIYNEASSNPTLVLRDGGAIQVPPRDPRGVRVLPGDELQLGRAVLRFDYASAAPALTTG